MARNRNRICVVRVYMRPDEYAQFVRAASKLRMDLAALLRVGGYEQFVRPLINDAQRRCAELPPSPSAGRS